MLFEKIDEQIQSYIDVNRVFGECAVSTCGKLSLMDAIFCARDKVRNRKFFLAIQDALRFLRDRKVVVVDAGAGIGLLGIYALCLGVDKCYFLEFNPHTLDYSRGLVDDFGFISKSIFLNCDATEVVLPEKYSLLLSETIVSGFVEEDFVQIVNNLAKFGEEESIIIPQRFITEVIKKDKKGEVLDKFKIEGKSGAGLQRPAMDVRNPALNHIVYKTTACLFGDCYVFSGECMSFLNERVVEV